MGRRFLPPLLIVLATITSARADSPSVTAVLSDSEPSVGQPVQLEIRVTGASNPKPPAEITVEGLDIRSAGVSRQYQMNNFNVSYSFTYNYTILPWKAGTFKIPPQSVEIGGKTLQTPELTLTVRAASGQSSRPGPNRSSSAANLDPSQIGFVEMVLPKAVAYVGEMVPVQIRLGLYMRTPVESLGNAPPLITGQGFTTQTFPEPRQTVETINGRAYQVFIFKTAISAVRSGNFELAAEVHPVVRVPRTGQRNPSLPRDLFDDPFFNNFFNDPALAPSVAKEIHLKSQALTLEVKPLPPSAPPDFSGAVGTFSLKADAAPKKAQAGDPITITAVINGRGNFDRVTAPALEDENGWHKYPPSDNFKQDDDVGISGAKSFEMVLSAKERKDKIPALIFSFFDPIKESYVTLRSDPIPVSIAGGAASAPAPTAAATASQPQIASTPTPAKQEQDILYQLTERPATPQSFVPLYQRQIFWLAQLLPLFGLVGFVAWKISRARSGDREAQRIARLQHEASELYRRLHREDVSPQEYMADASRAVQLKAALARNVDPNAVDADAAAAAFQLDDEQRARLRELFRERDEMRYSGDGNGHRITPQHRREILELVDNLRQ